MPRSNTSGKKNVDATPSPHTYGSLGFTPTAGRCLVVYGGFVVTVGTPSGGVTVADNLGGSWTVRYRSNASASYIAFIAWRENIPSGITSVSVTVPGTGSPGGYSSAAVDEFDDILASSALDQTSGGSGDMSAAAVSSGNITTTWGHELLLTAAVSDDSSPNTAWDAIGGSGSWTQSFQEQDTTAHTAAQAGYQYVNGKGTYNSTQRYSISLNNPNDNVVIVSLKRNVSLVATDSAQSNVSVASITTPGVDTSGANMLVAQVTCSGNVLPAMSDSNGNTWTNVQTQINNGGDFISLFVAYNATVGAAHTVTAGSLGGNFATICIAAYAGMASASAFDVKATGTGNSTTLSAGPKIGRAHV